MVLYRCCSLFGDNRAGVFDARLRARVLRDKNNMNGVVGDGYTVFSVYNPFYAVLGSLGLLRISSIMDSISFSLGMSMIPTAVK